MSQDINDKWLNSIFKPVTANNFDLEETETSPVYQIEDAIPSTSYTIPTTSYGGEKKGKGERGKMPKTEKKKRNGFLQKKTVAKTKTKKRQKGERSSKAKKNQQNIFGGAEKQQFKASEHIGDVSCKSRGLKIKGNKQYEENEHDCEGKKIYVQTINVQQLQF